jgi:hypothetical protein
LFGSTRRGQVLKLYLCAYIPVSSDASVRWWSSHSLRASTPTSIQNKTRPTWYAINMATAEVKI